MFRRKKYLDISSKEKEGMVNVIFRGRCSSDFYFEMRKKIEENLIEEYGEGNYKIYDYKLRLDD